MTAIRFVAHLHLLSAGWKAGPPPPADLYLDCRILPNPAHQPKLGGASGDHPSVQNWMRGSASKFISSFRQEIIDGLDQVPGRRNGKDDPWAAPYRIAFVCAHGIHRSKAMKHIIADLLKEEGWVVSIE